MIKVYYTFMRMGWVEKGSGLAFPCITPTYVDGKKGDWDVLDGKREKCEKAKTTTNVVRAHQVDVF